MESHSYFKSIRGKVNTLNGERGDGISTSKEVKFCALFNGTGRGC